ncbi:MAG: bifunctional pyr operon transcriptional regulator/uracil phosphoribosyltransferase PyrR [Candidatus Marinimicrobia bacterium]|nr:bifunctional pyr operon transcriptional regulator/uracil phosphoribosyltransferase PyrR [Candidatus Neomarinimicrobiota bacterium]MBL7023237.1 bifunctional pyr operon transcriptional regulator/uracil phosphoribosyltransferase PyrR [Candidatus Neomarinimicrobiota bacterium]MBL7110023.1 bifunctional pyr operon transcriptional regulator/uracil phosphoribosyltransferase PyrR [Candidatus Neomarinimicrobiota bacterium]
MKLIKSKLMEESHMKRTLIRLSHEIIENNPDLENVALIGIRTRGEFLAKRIRSLIEDISKEKMKYGTLDVTFYRDDFKTNLGSPQVQSSEVLFSLDDINVILIDDVLYTGRTIRAAMDELFSFGRPASIQLCVLVDRGHRELPVKADFIGKNYPTSLREHIHVHVNEVDNEDAVLLMEYGEDE